jgi:hypothetical protein
MDEDQETEESLQPLAAGTTRSPPTIGAGCAARFDPDALDDSLGADFAAAAQWLREQRCNDDLP